MLARSRMVFLAVLMAVSPLSGAVAQMHVGLEIGETPTPITEIIEYQDKGGRLQTLNPLKNKLTVLHFWASWCLPCIDEIRDIDTISSTYAGKGLTIAPLSLDTTGIKTVKEFYRANNIIYLMPMLDANMGMFKEYKLKGLPGTIFIDAKGREIARASGPLDWNSPETLKFIDAQLNAEN